MDASEGGHQYGEKTNYIYPFKSIMVVNGSKTEMGFVQIIMELTVSVNSQ